MNNKQILKSLYGKKLAFEDAINNLNDVDLNCIHTGEITDTMIDQASISPELYQVILKNCSDTGLPVILCHYDNGVLWPGIGRGQR